MQAVLVTFLKYIFLLFKSFNIPIFKNKSKPLSPINRLKIHLQGTCALFCATSEVQMYFLNTDFMLLVIYS